MRKVLCVLLATLLAVGMAACAPKAVTFADPVLEAMVRGAMGKPKGSITVADAEAVTRISLSIKWQQDDPGAVRIKDISGLENFKNLETLDLSGHAIADITPIVGLKKLTSLLLDGNPITDIAPLVSLTSLQYLYLDDCPVPDYNVLEDIYPNLKGRDFIIATSLRDLGFAMDDGNILAEWRGDGVYVSVNHHEWGVPAMDLEGNSVRMYKDLDSGFRLIVGYYPAIKAYVFGMTKDGKTLMNYVYDEANGVNLAVEERDATGQIVRAALGETGDDDALLSPIPIFHDTIKATVGIDADALYALPY